jgi:ethanolamine utilization protein EutN
MLLARVEGNLTATRKHPSLNGWRLLICQPVSQTGVPEGSLVVAIDSLGAALHQAVIVSTDGAAARQAVKDAKSPVRMMIIGMVDEISAGTEIAVNRGKDL